MWLTTRSMISRSSRLAITMEQDQGMHNWADVSLGTRSGEWAGTHPADTAVLQLRSCSGASCDVPTFYNTLLFHITEGKITIMQPKIPTKLNLLYL